MFEDYDGFIDLGNILFDTYHYSYDPDHLADFYDQDFVEMEGNGVTAMCWIQYKGKKYLFKPMEDASINWWGELLSYQLAKELGIPCCSYRACKLGNEYGVVTEMITKENETLVLGSQLFQEFFNQFPTRRKELISALDNKGFQEMYQIPERFIKFNLYDQQRHLFSYLNNLEQVWGILSDFRGMDSLNPKFGFSAMTLEEVTSHIQFFTQMLLFDIVSLQGDRHVNNWGTLCENNSFSACPLFDNATSFGVGYSNIRAQIYDFRNVVMSYRLLKSDTQIQDVIYQARPQFTLSEENNIDPMYKVKDTTLNVFDDFLRKSDVENRKLAYSFLDAISGDRVSILIDRAEKENGIVMNESVRFYIESVMDYHSKYLGEVADKYRVRSESYGK